MRMTPIRHIKRTYEARRLDDSEQGRSGAGANRIVPGTGAAVVVLVPCGEYAAQFGQVPGARGDVQLVEEGQCGSRFQVAVDVVEARPKAEEDC